MKSTIKKKIVGKRCVQCAHFISFKWLHRLCVLSVYKINQHPQRERNTFLNLFIAKHENLSLSSSSIESASYFRF